MLFVANDRSMLRLFYLHEYYGFRVVQRVSFMTLGYAEFAQSTSKDWTMIGSSTTMLSIRLERLTIYDCFITIGYYVNFGSDFNSDIAVA